MIEVSAGIIYSGSRILCFKKGTSKHSYLSNKYEFPGGKLESNESPEQALVREFKEELDLNIDIKSLQPVCSIDYSYPDFDMRIHAFLTQYNGQDPTLKEHVSMIWVDVNNLLSLDWAPADLKIILSIGDHLE